MLSTWLISLLHEKFETNSDMHSGTSIGYFFIKENVEDLRNPNNILQDDGVADTTNGYRVSESRCKILRVRPQGSARRRHVGKPVPGELPGSTERWPSGYSSP